MDQYFAPNSGKTGIDNVRCPIGWAVYNCIIDSLDTFNQSRTEFQDVLPVFLLALYSQPDCSG